KAASSRLATRSLSASSAGSTRLVSLHPSPCHSRLSRGKCSGLLPIPFVAGQVALILAKVAAVGAPFLHGLAPVTAGTPPPPPGPLFPPRAFPLVGPGSP